MHIDPKTGKGTRHRVETKAEKKKAAKATKAK
jgi:hypothetical protein